MGNALFAFPGLKRTQSQDRNGFSFPGHAVHVERLIHSKKGGKTGERKKWIFFCFYRVDEHKLESTSHD